MAKREAARRRRPYRVLSLDGGGIRGLLTLVLLERLEAACPGWLAKADLIAGTSTGGILALGLAHGLSLADLRALYEKRGRAIFRDSALDDVRDLGNALGAQYDNRALSRELRTVFGNARLRDLRRRVLIPAFDLDNEDPDPAKRRWAPKFFHNFPGADTDAECPVYKVALYTSAAPTYFPSVDGYIDGGVVANNPAMAALAQTQDRRAAARPPRLERVALLSLGTGTPLLRRPERRIAWGWVRWGRPIIDLMLDGVAGVADYQCRQLLRDRYHRLAPAFPPGKNIALDAVDRTGELVAFAERVDVGPAAAWLRAHWRTPGRLGRSGGLW